MLIAQAFARQHMKRATNHRVSTDVNGMCSVPCGWSGWQSNASAWWSKGSAGLGEFTDWMESGRQSWHRLFASWYFFNCNNFSRTSNYSRITKKNNGKMTRTLSANPFTNWELQSGAWQKDPFWERHRGNSVSPRPNSPNCFFFKYLFELTASDTKNC